MKKFFSFLIIIFSTFILCSCASVQYLRTYDSTNGQILDQLVIELDESSFDSAIKLNLIKNAINSDFIEYKNAVRDWAITYNNEYTNGVSVDKIEYNNQTKIVIRTLFNSVDSFLMFYGYFDDAGPFSELITSKSNKETNTESFNAFVYKYNIVKNSTMLEYIVSTDFKNNVLKETSTDSFYSKYYKLYYGVEPSNNEGLDIIQVSQLFSTDLDRLYTNADEQISENGVTSYYWNLNNKLSTNEDFKLEIYGMRAKTSTWYYLALVITLLTLIYVLIYYYKKRKVRISNNNSIVSEDISERVISSGVRKFRKRRNKNNYTEE